MAVAAKLKTSGAACGNLFSCLYSQMLDNVEIWPTGHNRRKDNDGKLYEETVCLLPQCSTETFVCLFFPCGTSKV